MNSKVNYPFNSSNVGHNVKHQHNVERRQGFGELQCCDVVETALFGLPKTDEIRNLMLIFKPIKLI